MVLHIFATFLFLCLTLSPGKTVPVQQAGSSQSSGDQEDANHEESISAFQANVDSLGADFFSIFNNSLSFLPSPSQQEAPGSPQSQQQFQQQLLSNNILQPEYSELTTPGPKASKSSSHREPLYSSLMQQPQQSWAWSQQQPQQQQYGYTGQQPQQQYSYQTQQQQQRPPTFQRPQQPFPAAGANYPAYQYQYQQQQQDPMSSMLPLMMMMGGGDSSGMSPLLMMSMMGGGGMGSMSNSMLPMMLMMGNDDPSSGMNPLMMMSMMGGIQGGMDPMMMMMLSQMDSEGVQDPKLEEYLNKQWKKGKRRLSVDVKYGSLPLEYQYLMNYHGFPTPYQGGYMNPLQTQSIFSPSFQDPFANDRPVGGNVFGSLFGSVPSFGNPGINNYSGGGPNAGYGYGGSGFSNLGGPALGSTGVGSHGQFPGAAGGGGGGHFPGAGVSSTGNNVRGDQLQETEGEQ